jgi:TonB family protein
VSDHRPRLSVGAIFIAAVGAGAFNAQRAAVAQTPPCDVERTPRSLPPLSSLLDSVRLWQQVSGQTFAARPRDVVVSLLIGESGRPVAASITDSSASPAVVEDVRTAVLTGARRQPPGDVWGVRVIVTIGATPRIRLDYAELCPPTIDPASLITRPDSRYRVTREQARSIMRRASDFEMSVAIDRDGNVENVSILRSFGGLQANEIAIEEVMKWKFRPLRIDNVAAAAVLKIDQLRLIGLIGLRR